MVQIRTRFAPSPTGFPHIGNFRTAMYAWAWARHNAGKFILRIEDTDAARTVPGSVQYLLNSLQWLGIDIDEGPSQEELYAIGEDYAGAPILSGPYGPYVQSLRKLRYQEVATQLIETGHAFRCDCSAETLEEERNRQIANKEVPGYNGRCRTRDVPDSAQHVVRFRMPDTMHIVLEDIVRGRVVWEHPALKDPVLLKTDGLPTYHLASVVDDHDMKITHVLRGEEWLPSAPLHVLLYEALRWEKPTFAHLSTVLGPDGKKLSKRHGAQSLDFYRTAGYLPEALLNYVFLVGWSPGDDREVLSSSELIELFTLDKLGNSNGIFDVSKLDWMNGVHIRALPIEKFTQLARKTFSEMKPDLDFKEESWLVVARHVQERIKLLPEMIPLAEFLFLDVVQYERSEIENLKVPSDTLPELLNIALARLSELSEYRAEKLEELLKSLASELNLKVGPVFLVIRIAVMGKKGPLPLNDSLVALGKDTVLKRLSGFIKFVQSF